VFVHGLIGHLRSCASAASAEGRETLAPDLLGYGGLAGVPESAVTLPDQVAELRACIRHAYGDITVDVVGHSVGGVIAMLYASQEPSSIRRLVSVEGNFSLKDAFWSASLGRMSRQEAAAVLAGFTANPSGWLARSGVPSTSENVALATEWLAFQPATTLRAMGRSLVEVTGAPSYLELVRNVFASHPVCLLSGARSRAAWDVPPWASLEAAAEVNVPDAGHMIMLEQPDTFIKTLLQMLAYP